MKTSRFFAAATILVLTASSIFSQTLEPGVYESADKVTHVTVKLSGNKLLFNDGRDTSEYLKIAENKYLWKEYSLILMAGENGKLVMTNQEGSFKTEYGMYAPANGQPAPGVMAFTWHDNRYYAAPNKDPRFTGTYKTEDEGKFGPPLVHLDANGSGSFQMHGGTPIPITWWMETSITGEVRKIKGARGDRYTLVVKYGPGGGGNYPEGSFDRMQFDVWPDKAVILGERVKPL